MAMTELPVKDVVRQRSFRVRKSLRDLINKATPHKTQHNLSLPLPSLPDDKKSGLSLQKDYAYDILYQCQRGSWTMGYSYKTLLQFDPNPWCDADMQYTPMDTTTYQLPDPTWQWVSREWMVDMSGDVDEAGWQYALKFHGAVWHGNYKHFRSFVRRRRWIRLRCRLQPADSKRDQTYPALHTGPSCKLSDVANVALVPASPETLHIQTYHDLMNNLKSCRLDRERLVMLNHSLSVSGMPDKILREADEVLNMLEYESSKRDLLNEVLRARHMRDGKRTLDEDERLAIQTLLFYSDAQSLLDIFETKTF